MQVLGLDDGGTEEIGGPANPGAQQSRRKHEFHTKTCSGRFEAEDPSGDGFHFKNDPGGSEKKAPADGSAIELFFR